MKFPFYLFIFFLVICEVFNKNNNVKAMTKCEESNFTECLWTPNKYEVTIFEMGLCSEDPLESVTSTNTDDIDPDFTFAIDEKSCVKTFTSDTGHKTNLANLELDSLIGNNMRPTNGTYRYSYAKTSNIRTLNASYNHEGKTYCSTSGNNFPPNTDYIKTDYSEGCISQDWEEKVIDFRGATFCTYSPRMATYNSTSFGAIKVVITTSAYGSSLAGKSCPYSTVSLTSSNPSDYDVSEASRFFASFEPNEPIEINNETSSLNMIYTVKDVGMVVNPDSWGNHVANFAGNALLFKFTTD